MIGPMTVGPLSFSGGLLTTFAAIFALTLAGNVVGRKRGVAVERKLWTIIGVALLAARAVYVARYWTFYAAAPLGILDIRDGGFHLPSGLCAGLAVTLWLAMRQRAARAPLLAGAVAGAAVFGLSALLALALPSPAMTLPDMALKRLDGGTLALSSLKGKPVVLNIWASWCGPCRREMPVLQQAQKAHPDIAFVFVNQEETPEVIRAYLGQEHIALANVVLDERRVLAKALGSKALPTTYFISARGELRGRRTGELSAATLAERLADLHASHGAGQ